DGPLPGVVCGGTITRTYTVADDCGNTTSCTQIITVNDDTDPSITCPGAVTVQCSGNVPPAATTIAAFVLLGGTASDNCDTDLTLSHVDGPLTGGICGGTITRTYTVADDCGNTTSCTQIITVNDDTDPSITCPGAVTVQCSGNVP